LSSGSESARRCIAGSGGKAADALESDVMNGSLSGRHPARTCGH
jgi:hypothetical protein